MDAPRTATGSAVIALAGAVIVLVWAPQVWLVTPQPVYLTRWALTVLVG